jgi:hypothetical protein
MKKNKLFILSVTLIIVLLVTACSAVVYPSTPTAKPYITEEITMQPSITPSQIGSLRPTYDPPPTLVPELQDQLFNLLKSNGNCELPCFLGIAPGKTTWTEAKTFLVTYSINKPIIYDETRSTPTNRTYSATIQTQANQETSSWIDMNISLDVDNNDLVKDLVVTFEIFGDDSSPFYDTHLSRYSLREVFQKNGMPDIIYFAPEREEGFTFNVIYEKLKMAITFSGRLNQNTDGRYTVCPNFGDGEIESMKIAFANSSDPIDISALIGYSSPNDSSFENTAGMSLINFYDLMIGNQLPACFQLK